MSSARNAFAFPVVASTLNGGHRGNGGHGGSIEGGGHNGGGHGLVQSGFLVDVGLSGDLFVHVGNSLGPSEAILVVTSNVDHRGNGGHRGNGSDGSNGDGVPCGGSVPGTGEFGFGGLDLGGVRNVELGEGLGGHSQSSKNNLKQNMSW